MKSREMQSETSKSETWLNEWRRVTNQPANNEWDREYGRNIMTMCKYDNHIKTSNFARNEIKEWNQGVKWKSEIKIIDRKIWFEWQTQRGVEQLTNQPINYEWHHQYGRNIMTLRDV